MKIIPLKSLKKDTPLVKKYIDAVKNGYSVAPSSSGWSVKRDDAERAVKNFESQKEAIKCARKIAMNQHAELSIHTKDGKIREKNSCSGNSFPPRG